MPPTDSSGPFDTVHAANTGTSVQVGKFRIAVQEQ
jgi:hypothetical protein